MNNDSSQKQICAEVKSGIVTIEIKTDYGPITISYSPSHVKASIASLAASILKHSKEGESLGHSTEHLGLTSEEVTEAAALYEERSNKVFPSGAIEQVSPGSEAYSRGTVEQFSENLVPALILMLDYLAATALVLAGTDSDPRWEQKVKNEHKATVKLLQDHLGASIRRLWIRQPRENVDNDTR